MTKMSGTHIADMGINYSIKSAPPRLERSEVGGNRYASSLKQGNRLTTTYGVVGKTITLHALGVKQIATIEYHRLT